jgi:hypothetical protein
VPDPVASVDFPLHGVWLRAEFGEQPAGTAAAGVNVRALDPFQKRYRGGSRTGIVKSVGDRVNGYHPIQCLDFVVTVHPSATLFAVDQSADGPGVRIADPSTSNFPDGPGATGPGGNAQGGPTGQPGFNRRQPASPFTVRQGGNGVMRQRTRPPVIPPVPPPPSPPPPPPPGSPFSRTFTPFAELHTAEIVGSFRLGPITEPLAGTTDFSDTGGLSVPVDYYGDGFTIQTALSTYGGSAMPTVLQINAMFVAAGWADGGHPDGPYETSTDS